jgi:hypothetical protein
LRKPPRASSRKYSIHVPCDPQNFAQRVSSKFHHLLRLRRVVSHFTVRGLHRWPFCDLAPRSSDERRPEKLKDAVLVFIALVGAQVALGKSAVQKRHVFRASLGYAVCIRVSFFLATRAEPITHEIR